MYCDIFEVITDVLLTVEPDGDSKRTITVGVPAPESVPVAAVTNTR